MVGLWNEPVHVISPVRFCNPTILLHYISQ